MLAAENWCLKVEGKVYGPYTTQQMRKFAHEGRLASWSMVSPAGSRAWREARNEHVFSQFFGTARPAPQKPEHTGPTFGKRSDEPLDVDANETQTKADPETKNPVRTPAAENELRAANFIVIFDVVSAAATRVEAAMQTLGPAFRIADNVWNVTCELTAVGVRNAIAPYLRGNESIFVVDATRGRTSWSNYAPEPQSKLTAAYIATKQS